MADNNPFAVRMDEDAKAELIELIEDSGKSNKDFMNVLISTYKLNRAKAEVPSMAEDINHLEALTKQICEVYLGVAKRITTIQESNKIEFNKELSLYKDKIENLEGVIASLRKDLEINTQEFSNLSSLYDESQNQILSLKNSLEDKNKIIGDKINLIDEYKEKNDTLLSMLNDFQKSKDEIETYKELLAVSQSKNNNLENTIDKLKFEHENQISKISNDNDIAINKLTSKVNTVNESLSTLKTNYSKEINQLKKDHENELNNLKNSYEYEKNRSLLEQEKNFNTLITNLKIEYSDKIALIQVESNKQVLEYQKEINSLLHHSGK